MLDINSFPDISELTDVDTNFRIFAGPGAGKTTWLIQHLIKVLKTSCWLYKTRKIACITYTNVAAEEIINKLNCDKCRLDISTIHSFLYRNIVKPFSHLIANDENGDPIIKGKRPDGKMLTLAEMSDGSRDQLFLALRLGGLARYVKANGPMPFIVDDVLVHFDDDRSKAALTALGELATQTQVVFFTHHKHLITLAESAVTDDILHVHDL